MSRREHPCPSHIHGKSKSISRFDLVALKIVAANWDTGKLQSGLLPAMLLSALCGHLSMSHAGCRTWGVLDPSVQKHSFTEVALLPLWLVNKKRSEKIPTTYSSFPSFFRITFFGHPFLFVAAGGGWAVLRSAKSFTCGLNTVPQP